MRRSDPKARARSRILNDDEIRTIWKAAEENGVFGAFVRMSLLTGQRAGKIQCMKWEHIENGVWHIPAEAREKGNAGDLVLPDMALDILKNVPRFASGDYVFTYNGTTPLTDSNKWRFAAKVDIAPWVIHDLRRTARSLMARAGVRPDVAERVLGHVIRGVEGIYDRHSYQGACASGPCWPDSQYPETGRREGPHVTCVEMTTTPTRLYRDESVVTVLSLLSLT